MTDTSLTNEDRRKFFRDTSLFALAGACSVLAPMGLVPVLTRTLSVQDFASFVLISSAVSLLIPFMGFGAVNAVIVRFFSLDREKLRVYLSSVYAAVMISAIVYILAGAILEEYLIQLFKPGFGFFTLAILVAAISAFSLSQASLYIATADATGYLRAYFSFGVTLVISTVLFCWGFDLGLIGACFAMLCGQIAFAFTAYFGTSVTRLVSKWSAEDLKDSLRFGSPLMIHSVAVALISFGDRFAVSRWHGSDAVASYGVTAQFSLLVGYFFHSVHKVLQPKVFALLRIGDSHSERTAVSYLYLYSLAVVVISMVFWALLPIIIIAVVGEEFRVGSEVYSLLVAGSACNAIYLALGNFVFFREKTIKLSLITVVSALSYLLLLYILGPRYGLPGIAFSYAVTNTLMMVLTALLVNSCIDVRWLDKKIFFPRMK